ncbi:embryonic protein UVS.2 [Folsomia candida]|uniref:Exoskeleton protein RP43 n=1 Tax=Folsomia candida TaxID=158441 RepID=A0A226F1G6_FOLCA|nr:embryonic protein UVS.2 [Folsomia candida]OXA63051.1 Exoskeleton protein RP43 [Folsomia candida]
MNSTGTIVLLAFLFAVVTAAPQPNQGRSEDPEPVVSVTTCGGHVNASSASIEFQLGGSIRADMRCVWIVRAPYAEQRFNLISSGLKQTDGIYITPVSFRGLGNSEKLSTLGQNVTLHSRSVMITLIVGHAPTFGFKMEYYSSGTSVSPDITSHAILTTAKGNVTYPSNGGDYGNLENVLFPIAPSVPGQPTLRFTRVDIETGSSCQFDYVKIYNWFDGNYLQVAIFCGTTIPVSVTFQDGAGVVFFSSDSSFTRAGFDFQYE